MLSRRSSNSQPSSRWDIVGTSGFFLVGGRIFTSGAHVEDVSAFHARPPARMLPDRADGEASCDQWSLMVGKIRAWTMFGLLPLMLLHRPRGSGAVGRSELAHPAGGVHWRVFMEEALRIKGRSERSDAEESERRGKAAQVRGAIGIHRRYARTQERYTGIRAHADRRSSCGGFPECVPIAEVSQSAKMFDTCLKEPPSSLSPGPGGCTNEMLKVSLDNTEALHLLTSAAEDFAGSSVPDCILKGYRDQHVSNSCRTRRSFERLFRSLCPLVRGQIMWDTPCELSPITTRK